MMDSRNRKRNRELESEYAKKIEDSRKDDRLAKKIVNSQNRKRIRETDSEFANKIVDLRKRLWIRETDKDSRKR